MNVNAGSITTGSNRFYTGDKCKRFTQSYCEVTFKICELIP
jgi:hypothetical protein